MKMINQLFGARLNCAVLETLNSLRITSVDCGHPMLWGNAEADILREILRVDACSREVMLAKLHEVLVRTGHENVGLHLKGLYAPDGVPFPEAFAYVLGKDLVSGADRARIRFDHGQNTTSYLKEHFHIDLPWRALDMLLSQNDETPHTHTAEECLCC